MRMAESRCQPTPITSSIRETRDSGKGKRRIPAVGRQIAAQAGPRERSGYREGARYGSIGRRMSTLVSIAGQYCRAREHDR